MLSYEALFKSSCIHAIVNIETSNKNNFGEVNINLKIY